MKKFLTRYAHWIALILAGVFGLMSALNLLFPASFASFDPRVSATIAALLFAVFSYFSRSVEQEIQSRKQHTIKILFDTRLSPEFRQYLEKRKYCFAEGSVIVPETYRAYLAATRTVDISDDEANRRRKSAEAVRSLLNYYEFISYGIESGDLDETMLNETIRGMVCRLVADAHLVIADYQKTEPRTFAHLTALYRAWKDADQPDIP